MMRKIFISFLISSFVFSSAAAQFNIPKQKPRNQSALNRVVVRPVYEIATPAATTVAPAATTAVATTAVATTATPTAMPASAYPINRAVKSAGTYPRATNYSSSSRTYSTVSAATETATPAYSPSYDRKAMKADAKAPASRAVALPRETIPPAKKNK
jgi:hypothetical protein